MLSFPDAASFYRPLKQSRFVKGTVPLLLEGKDRGTSQNSHDSMWWILKLASKASLRAESVELL